MSNFPTHTHHSDYAADPVMRVPSPASSVGTSYGPDQTSPSDWELKDDEFARRCNERIRLNFPMDEEMQADKDPLLTIIGPNGRPVRVGEQELDTMEMQRLHERVMVSLREEVAQLRENELFEQILLRGSKAALDIQPVTNDIDTLMRGMMGPGLSLNSGPHMGKISPPTESLNRAATTTGAATTNGPWNNWGQSSEPERKYSMLSTDPMLSGTTVGKRSRNGTARKA